MTDITTTIAIIAFWLCFWAGSLLLTLAVMGGDNLREMLNEQWKAKRQGDE